MQPPPVELSAVAAFIRQHTHDIRNHLNGLDLEAALLGEIVTDTEASESVARMRRQIRVLAEELKVLSAKFTRNEPSRSAIEAREMFLIWQDQATALGLKSIDWSSTLGDERIEVDVAAIDIVLKELLVNAKQFTGGDGIEATARMHGGKIEFELREPKREPVDPKAWGALPFTSTKRGGYGLGLWRASRLVTDNGGQLVHTFLPEGILSTKLTFPAA